MRQLKKISAKNSKKIEDLLGLLDLGKVEQIKQSSGLFQTVNDVLRKYKGFPRVIWDKDIDEYFEKCYTNCIVAIDTETNNSVDPITAIMVGLCLFTPYSRPVYIPVNHYDALTLKKVPNQVSIEKLAEKVEKFKGLFCIYHNAKFDVNVIDTNLGIRLPISWDTMIGAKVLNENDLSASLKSVYVKYIEPAQPTYNISNLFQKNKTAPVEDFTLYSAIDSYDTYKVYLMQKKVLESPTMQKLYHLLVDVEFKITEIAAQMEFEGANFDKDLAEVYLHKFEKLTEEKQEELNKFFEPLKYKSDFNLQEWPINVSSSAQVVSALNAMGIVCEDSQEPTLSTLGKVHPICNTILECRSANHMVTSFFKPYLEMINPKTGRLHASFNQMGSEDKTVKTGRFSCQNPNLQQLPSFDDSVRLCFSGVTQIEEKEFEDELELYENDEVETADGYKYVKDLKVGDQLIDPENIKNEYKIKSISIFNSRRIISFED